MSTGRKAAVFFSSEFAVSNFSLDFLGRMDYPRCSVADDSEFGSKPSSYFGSLSSSVHSTLGGSDCKSEEITTKPVTTL